MNYQKTLINRILLKSFQFEMKNASCRQGKYLKSIPGKELVLRRESRLTT